MWQKITIDYDDKMNKKLGANTKEKCSAVCQVCYTIYYLEGKTRYSLCMQGHSRCTAWTFFGNGVCKMSTTKSELMSKVDMRDAYAGRKECPGIPFF